VSNGLILGRSPNLILGAFTALFNVIVLSKALPGLTPELVAGVNIAAGAVIALIANVASVQIAAGDAAKARQS
jgi:hypothetical protein